MNKAAELEPARVWEQVSLVLMDDEGIRGVNAAYLNRDKATDVISFAYDPLPGEAGMSGEVIVNVQRATEEGIARSTGVPRELALYIMHGCLHLTGADDADADGRAFMDATQATWLDAAHDAGMLEELTAGEKG
jgi:probable rRNA maturation factor